MPTKVGASNFGKGMFVLSPLTAIMLNSRQIRCKQVHEVINKITKESAQSRETRLPT